MSLSDGDHDNDQSDESPLPSDSASWDDLDSNENGYFGELDEESVIFPQIVLVATHAENFFIANELEDGGQPSVNPSLSVCDKLASKRPNLLMFKNLTKFTIEYFEDLCLDVCPTIDCPTCQNYW